MKQYQAVIETLDRLGGIATLAQLYQQVFKIKDCKWRTKTPLASVRRIVQTRKEIYKVKPGLYALRDKRKELEAKGIYEENKQSTRTEQNLEFNHTYYQGLLLQIAKMRKLDSWSPNSDRNKIWLGYSIGSLRTLQHLPPFSYPEFIRRSATVDVIWFNQRKMPHSFFEIEFSTDIQNSLLKFYELQDFYARMVIASHSQRRKEFENKIRYSAFAGIVDRVTFIPFESIVESYEREVATSKMEMPL